MLTDGGEFARNTFIRNGSWLGLFCDGMTCQVQEAVVAIGDSTKKNILDEDEPTEVVHALGYPAALFNGLIVPQGPTQTWYRQPLDNWFQPRDHLADPPFKDLKRLGFWKMPWGKKPLSISWVRLPNGSFRYHISDGKKKQFLFAVDSEGHYGGDTTPSIYWVGDLDQDGAIDMILSLPDDNCGIDIRLYLSSTAESDEIMHKSAQLSGSEPACGC